MRIAAIIPVGPGHIWVHDDCADSVKLAAKRISDIELDCKPYPDHEGKLGRSRARNLAIEASPEADWYFLIDADDLCCIDAFELFRASLAANPRLVAVFGAINSDQMISELLTRDNVFPLDWAGIMERGAKGTLAMGCFIRADVARATPFNEEMDIAEDFDFYLRALHRREWAKIDMPLVTIRHNVPSAGGPRGLATIGWREACGAVVERYRSELAG